MNYNKTKSTKRFTFGVSRNPTSKKAGSNTVTITTNPEAGRYSFGGTALTMTVREAQALKSFLNETLSAQSDSDASVSI
jgi:hypothetical protein|tara:strand:+ start:186 stop:422 length:237 start_codon:yes stop_codon:yes gene_type:complete